MSRHVVHSFMDPNVPRKAPWSGPAQDSMGRGEFLPLRFVEFRVVYCFTELAKIRKWCSDIFRSSRWRVVADGAYFESPEAADTFGWAWNGRVLAEEPKDSKDSKDSKAPEAPAPEGSCAQAGRTDEEGGTP